MSDGPLVSAIIIFLNAAEFLDEAIQSVLNQTYAHWELLLVDDGSTDQSTAIALHYMQLYPEKIRYLEHPEHENQGMSAARNLGLKHATGTYVGFLDADDVWLSHKLEQQVALLETYPQAAMVYGRTLIWYSWTRDHPEGKRDRFYDLGVVPNTLVAPPWLLVLLLRNRVQTPTTCNALLRRALLARVGGFEQQFRGMFEDQVFFAKLELVAPVFVADECWAKYRQHPTNSSAIGWNTPAIHAARLRFLTWFERYLSAHETQPRAVWRVLRSELRPYRYPRLHTAASLPSRAYRRLRRRFGTTVRRALPAALFPQRRKNGSDAADHTAACADQTG